MIPKVHYRNALAVQTNKNMLAIVAAFDDAIQAVWHEARVLGKGEEWVNSHPIVVAFAGHIGFLVNSASPGYSQAIAACEREGLG